MYRYYDRLKESRTSLARQAEKDPAGGILDLTARDDE